MSSSVSQEGSIPETLSHVTPSPMWSIIYNITQGINGILDRKDPEETVRLFRLILEDYTKNGAYAQTIVQEPLSKKIQEITDPLLDSDIRAILIQNNITTLGTLCKQTINDLRGLNWTHCYQFHLLLFYISIQGRTLVDPSTTYESPGENHLPGTTDVLTLLK